MNEGERKAVNMAQSHKLCPHQYIESSTEKKK